MDAKKFHNKFMALEEAAKNEIVELLKNNPKGRFIQPNDHYDEDDFYFTEGVWALTGDADAIIVTAVGLFDDDKLMVRAQMMNCDYNDNEWFAFDEFTHCYWELYEFVVNHLDDADTEPVIVNDTSEDDLDDDDDNDDENDDDDASKCRVVDGVGIIPEGATEIGDYAFCGCTGLTSIVIPDSVEKIGDDAFRGCTGLTSIVIPDSVEEIGEAAFYDCKNLTSIVIPDSVEKIGDHAFRGCKNLTSIVVSEGNKVYDSRNNCNALIETESNSIIVGCKNTVIPDSVEKIGDDAFFGCTGLTSIVIPDSVEKIGDQAFWSCTGLTSIVIPDSVEKIGHFAFEDCTGLTSIVIPDSVEKIGDLAFKGYTGLTSIAVSEGNKVYDSRNNCNALIETESNSIIVGCKNTVIPDSVEKIGAFAFEGCTGLTSIVIPDSVKEIGDNVFCGCTGLTSIVIPDSVKKFGDDVFDECTNLEAINVPAKKINYYKKHLPKELHSLIKPIN